MSMASRAILSNFFEEQWTQNHPQYLSGLSRALFPTTFLEIAVYKKVLRTCKVVVLVIKTFYFFEVLAAVAVVVRTLMSNTILKTKFTLEQTCLNSQMLSAASCIKRNVSRN